MRVIKIICKILFGQRYSLLGNHIIGVLLIVIGFIFLLCGVCSSDVKVNEEAFFSPVIYIVVGLIIIKFKNIIHL